MKIENFEKQLQEIDQDISINHSANNPEGLSGVYYKGVFLAGCPQHEIFDEVNPQYGVEIQDRFMRHRTTDEVKGIVKATIERLEKDKDHADAFFGRGDYSDDNLS